VIQVGTQGAQVVTIAILVQGHITQETALGLMALDALELQPAVELTIQPTAEMKQDALG